MHNSASFTDILKTLVRTPSVVGAEHSFFRVLQRELEERGAKVSWYEGLLVAQGSRPDSLLISAHIDRHGLVCTGPNEFQYAAFVASSRSDLLGNSVSEEMMNTIADRFENVPVYAYEPWSGAYLGAGTISHGYICEHRHNLIFETKGLEYLTAGTPVAFRDSLRIHDGYYSGQLDNVLSAAVLVYLFQTGFQGTAFFTSQEEAGRSWRFLLEWFRRFGSSTNHLIVIDTSPFPTREEADKQHVVLRTRDANAAFNEALTAQMEALCLNLGIAFSYKDRYIEEKNKAMQTAGHKPSSLGSTEMGRIIAASRGLVDGTTLQLPTTGYHTTEETAAIAACDVYIGLLRSLAELEPLQGSSS
jgi:putative aminopeptidase FrvX